MIELRISAACCVRDFGRLFSDTARRVPVSLILSLLRRGYFLCCITKADGAPDPRLLQNDHQHFLAKNRIVSDNRGEHINPRICSVSWRLMWKDEFVGYGCAVRGQSLPTEESYSQLPKASQKHFGIVGRNGRLNATK